MMQPSLIPAPDPNPLPAPYWVFAVLLVTTFILHIVAMNFMLGGGVMALVAKWRSKDREIGNRVFIDLAKKLPVLLPATITLGIAPLLFVQVLYGQFFYTSSVLMAWPWLLVLVCLTVAYYGFYYTSFKGGQRPGRAGAVILGSIVLVFLIGFMLSNNITLSQTPQIWGRKYFADPAGWNLNLTDPSLFPRYLHFMVAALALGGLLVVFMALANWKRDNAYARQLLQFGGKGFMYATMAQVVEGVLFLVSLPSGLRLLFLGNDPVATMLFLIGILGSIASIVLMAEALRKEDIRMAAYHVPAIIAVVIVCMATMRDMLRNAYLAPYFRPGDLAVRTQWTVFPVFLGVFAAGAIFWFVMIVRYRKHAADHGQLRASKASEAAG